MPTYLYEAMDHTGLEIKETIEAEYPGIEIVDEKGVTGPDFAGQAQSNAPAQEPTR